MTTDQTTRARRSRILRKVIVSIGLLVQGAAAFKLSFGAQTLLAAASGIPAEDAWLYPFSVDAAIVTVSLIVVWSEKARTAIKVYLYTAIALWTGISVAGNALHTLALAASDITVHPGIAIAVNTVPALALFLTIHIATTTPIYRAEPAPTPQKPPRTARATPSEAPTAPKATRTDVPPPSIEELMELADGEGLSIRAIAERVGRSSSWVGEQIKTERERRAAA